MTPKEQAQAVLDEARYSADPRDPVTRLAAAFVAHLESLEPVQAPAPAADPATVDPIDPAAVI